MRLNNLKAAIAAGSTLEEGLKNLMADLRANEGTTLERIVSFSPNNLEHNFAAAQAEYHLVRQMGQALEALIQKEKS